MVIKPVYTTHTHQYINTKQVKFQYSRVKTIQSLEYPVTSLHSVRQTVITIYHQSYLGMFMQLPMIDICNLQLKKKHQTTFSVVIFPCV